MIFTVKIDEEPTSPSITLYIPATIDNYICSRSSNRSEWIREAGEDFLKLIEGKIIENLNRVGGKEIISISKPDGRSLRKIFSLVKKDSLFFSRSEFFRMSIFFKMIIEILQEEVREKTGTELSQPEASNTVRVPISIDDNGDKVFKVYKILSKLDY